MAKTALSRFPVVVGWRVAVVVLAVAAKLWLVADLEIEDDLADPHEYLTQMLNPLDGGLAYPPGTGLACRLLAAPGLPLHLVFEIAFAGTLVLVLRALVDWPWRSRPLLFLFLFCLFNPAPAEMMSHLLSDTPWLLETLAGLALVVLAWRRVDRIDLPLLTAATALLALSAITRSLFVPLVAGWLLFVLLAWLWLGLSGTSRARGQVRLLAVGGAWVFGGVLMVYYGTCSFHAGRHNFFGLSAIDSAEYKSFYLRLQSVGPGDGPAHFPIDERRRRLIATAGPRSHDFIERMERNTFDKQVGFDLYGRRDFPGGWFHFAVFNTALQYSGGFLPPSFSILRGVGDEIDTAAREGRLAVRPILPLPDARVPIMLREIPSSSGNVARHLLAQPLPRDYVSTTNRVFALADFNAALHRHPAPTTPLREQIRSFLLTSYRFCYSPLLVLFALGSVAAAAFTVLRKPALREAVELPVLARQLFALFFVVFALWYLLFDASGLGVYTRYLMLQNVLLPILAVYYLGTAWRYRRGGPPTAPLA